MMYANPPIAPMTWKTDASFRYRKRVAKKGMDFELTKRSAVVATLKSEQT